MVEVIAINTKNPLETKTITIQPQKALNQECFLGRDERCCIVLNDTMVSRIHGKIAYHQGNYYYADLGSRNGSLLNNKKIKVNQNYPLKASDTITLGNYLIWIKEIGDVQSQPPETKALTPEEYMPLAGINPSSLTFWTKGELEVTCVRIIEETHDVKTFSFVAEPPILFNYQPGQFVTVNLKIADKLVKRSYSISSSPSRPHTLDITVKRVQAPPEKLDAPPGLVSNWLHDNIKVGSKIKLSPPVGKFTNFANPSPKLLLISAGSGITPMMSMARWVCDTASVVDITFIHSARSQKDIIFRQELELMAAKYSNFKLAITLTRPELGATWYGYTERLNNSILPAIAPDYQERTVYVCGSNPFMASVKSILQQLNFPMQNYYEESFGITKKVTSSPKTKTELIDLPELTGSPLPVTVGSNGHNYHELPSSANELQAGKLAVVNPPKKPVASYFVVEFIQSSKEITGEEGESILEVAQAEGIDLPYGCGMGICGQCKLPKIEGEVVYDGDFECEEDQVLTCVGKARGRVVIDA
ncbi:MAG: FHA domain-containing protein [Xenococcaceae cyanobacterium MO_207.B15]|nr:FHA domain-containing protein [Xenococcaceae cyanobacterium MO_207.B15]